MDYLEVTKNESLRKYEENVYLLGTIFSNKVKKDDLSDDSNDSDSDDSSIEEDIIHLFDNNKIKEPTKSFEKFNTIKTKIEFDINQNKDDSTSEPQSLFGNLCLKLDHFNLTLNDYHDTQNQLKEFNNNFKQETSIFSDLITK